jgi:thiol-disulfide isomerase/thioredoxin
MRPSCTLFGLSALFVVGRPRGGRAADPHADLRRHQAPEFDLQGPAGEPQRLVDHRGKPIILNFWATWCPPCRAEMPSMQRAHETVADEGISVIAVNVGEDAETVARFLRRRRSTSRSPWMSTPRSFKAIPSRVADYLRDRRPTCLQAGERESTALLDGCEREWDDPASLARTRSACGQSAACPTRTGITESRYACSRTDLLISMLNPEASRAGSAPARRGGRLCRGQGLHRRVGRDRRAP